MGGNCKAFQICCGKGFSYGGPTLTIALLPGSPAIDAGNPGGCNDPLGATLATDQRGAPGKRGWRDYMRHRRVRAAAHAGVAIGAQMTTPPNHQRRATVRRRASTRK
jgi:hypothetical protein